MMNVINTENVPIQKLVTEDGKQLIKTVFVPLEEAQKNGFHKNTEGKDALQKLLRKVRKDMGSPAYREMLKANGVEWEEAVADAPNTMRASVSAHKFLMDGNSIDLNLTGVTLTGGNKKSKSKPKPSQSQSKKEEEPEVPKPRIPEVPALYKLLNRLGNPYKEVNGTLVIGEGHKTVPNKYGYMDTAPGSVVIERVGKKEHFGRGHYVRLVSSFFDKDKIKTEMEGQYDPDLKKWYVPFRQIIRVMMHFDNVEIERKLLPTVKAVMEQIDVMRIDITKKPVETFVTGLRGDRIDTSEFVMPEGMSKELTLFDHQKKGFQFILENKKVVIGLAVGLGKTLTSITAMQELKNQGKIQRAVVICPSSVKYNWKKEIETFSSLKPMVINAKQLRKEKRIKATLAEAENADVLIINYDMLRKVETITKLSKLAPDCVIADEAHKLKNGKASQTKGFKMNWGTAEYRIFLSATPFPNGKPTETYTILSHVRPDRIGRWAEFGRKHIVWEGGGHGSKAVCLKDVDVLKEKMADIVFIRTHNSPDVVVDLPKERHTTYNLEMTEEQKKLYNAISEDIIAELDRLEEMGFNASSPAVIAKLKKLEQVAIDPDALLEKDKINMSKMYPKEEWAVQMITDHLEDPTNGGIVVFCDMKLPLYKIEQGLKDNGVDGNAIAYIMGGVKPEERTEVSAKLENGEVKVVLCTSAAEEGVNLQKGAHTLIHMDNPWVPKAVTQREGRVLRTGQESAYASFFTPLMTGTVEDRKRAALGFKIEAIEDLLGEGTAGSAKNNVQADDFSDELTFDDMRNLARGVE